MDTSDSQEDQYQQPVKTHVQRLMLMEKTKKLLILMDHLFACFLI